jgi:uncharacterized protein
MTQDFLEYPKLVESAMRGVVRSALSIAAEGGLPGLHHFYITFRTQSPGVEIGSRMLAQYPEEMTIVLEHRFWDLIVSEDRFSVTLSFGGIHENLIVPFDAVTAFVDPSVKFGLQFGAAEAAAAADAAPQGPVDEERGAPDSGGGKVGDGDGDGQVVALDRFRKK